MDRCLHLPSDSLVLTVALLVLRLLVLSETLRPILGPSLAGESTHIVDMSIVSDLVDIGPIERRSQTVLVSEWSLWPSVDG